MKTLLLLPLFLTLFLSTQTSSLPQDGSSVVVLSSRWSRSRQALEKLEPISTTAPAMIPENKNYSRNARINNPVGARDPNEDTIDGRHAALEKITQEARTPSTKPVDGYAYRAKIQNTSTKVIEIVFWEYQFIDPANPAVMSRRQFLCGVKINPAKDKELQAFSLSGPSDVISVQALGNKSENAFKERVLINRVEYADGTMWQRKEWNFGEIRLGYRRAVGTPWGAEMCRGL